jgi:predicted dehydrogenase
MDAKRFAVIGAGGWGSRHLSTYADHPLAELVAICDTNPDVLRAAGEEFGVDARYTDHAEMLEGEELDAVSIATPDFAHTDLAVAAVRSGVDVLIEKPLATTLQDCDAIGSALEENPVRFMVDFHNRWNPGMVKFRKAIEKGEVGQVQSVYYRLSDNISVPTGMLPWAASSSVNWFLASHCLDTLMWLLGDAVAEVYTVRRRGVLEAMGVDTADSYHSIITFAGGATAVLENSWILADTHPLIDFKIQLVGTGSTLNFDGRPHLVEQFGATRAEWPDVLVCPEVHGSPRGFGVDSIRHFIDCVLQGREPLCGFAEGRRVTEAVLAMERSADRGEAVRIG